MTGFHFSLSISPQRGCTQGSTS
ncbi:MAG: hypothetical protein QOD31_1015, partial [Pseudonocardiales bacterium]|nr:hypothetical protein [Pseudonocardiales bacterium]